MNNTLEPLTQEEALRNNLRAMISRLIPDKFWVIKNTLLREVNKATPHTLSRIRSEIMELIK